MLSLQTRSSAGPRLAVLPVSLSSRSTLSTRRTAIRPTELILTNQGSRNMSWWGRNSDWWKRVDPRFHKWVKQRLQDIQAQDQYSWKPSQLNPRLHKHRCFSRTNDHEAQHSNNGRCGSDKPEGLSDYEWARLSYIKILKKRLEEDPYNALFGKSNQWLNRREWKSSWISENFIPMLIRNEDRLTKIPKKKEDTTKSAETAANAQANSNSSGQEGSKQRLETSSSLLPPLPSSAPSHSSALKWVYDPITGRMVMEQVEESSKAAPTRNTQKNGAVDIPVKPFMGLKRKSTVKDSPSVLGGIDDGKILPHEVGNPLDDALAEYESRAKPYQVSDQGDNALDKALSGYENRRMAEHDYQHRHHSELLLPEQEWLVHGQPEAPKQHDPADNNSKQHEKHVEERPLELPTSFQKQVIHKEYLAHSKTDTGSQPNRLLSNEKDTNPPALASDECSNRKWEQQTKSSAPHKEWLVQEGFTESSSTNTFTTAPGKGHELKHDLIAPKKSEPEILRKLPRDDIDLLRPSDIRARMGIIRESRKETDDEKVQKRAHLEKNFDYVQRHCEGGLETSLERLIRVSKNKVAEQELERKPIEERSPTSSQEHSDLDVPAGSGNLVSKNAYGFDEWGYSRTPMGLETSFIDEVADVKNGKRKSLGEEMVDMSATATQARIENEHEVAAQHKLHEEIQAQKDAMGGLSDDGYSREPVELEADADKQNGLQNQLIEINREVEVTDSDVSKAEKEILDITAKRQQWLHYVALVKEIRNIYEDRYGIITTGHRQEGPKGVDELESNGMKAPGGLNDYENKMGPKLYRFTTGDDNLESEIAAMGVNPSVKALFDYSPTVTSVQSTVSSEPTASSPAVPSVTGTVPTEPAVPSSISKAPTNYKMTETLKAPNPRSLSVPTVKSTSEPTVSSTPTADVDEKSVKPSQTPEPPSSAIPPTESTKLPEPATESATDSSTTSPQSSSTANQESNHISTSQPSTPRVYKVLAYDPSTDTLTTATTLNPLLPSTSEPPIPLPTALSKLSNPGKFLPHLPPAFEPITSTANLLILRETNDASTTTTAATPATTPKSFNSEARLSTVVSPRAEESVESSRRSSSNSRRHINPVDGTTTPLPEAPTGNFASPTGFVNHDGFSAAEEGLPLTPPNTPAMEPAERSGGEGEGGRSERRGGGGAAGVTKTAIWATTVCYVAGVVGELMK